MRVLISGSSGFLGSHFMDYCIEAFGLDSVMGVDIKPDPFDRHIWVEDCVEFFATRDYPGLQFDLVIHMAAPVGGREKIEGDPLYNADSLRIDSAMFRWAVRHAKTVLYPSSSAVYGTTLQGEDAEPLWERLCDPRDPTWLAPDEMYGFTKLAGERLAVSAAKYGLHTLCIRPFSGYGPRQSMEYPVPSIALRASRHDNPITVWGPGTQQRDFVYVTDLIGAAMRRLDFPVVGYQTMNIASGVGTSFNEVAKMCATLMGYSAVVENISDKPMGVMNRIGDPRVMREYYDLKIPLAVGLDKVLNEMAANWS